MDSEFTRKFQVVQDRNEEMRATLMAVYDALKEKGYNPDQSDCRIYFVGGSHLYHEL